jgi:colanic acid biosynthesis glycosyl transferase WcaI
LKILVLGMHYSPEHSGNAPYTSGMAAALKKAGHDVRVVTGLPHYPQWRVTEGYQHWRQREVIDGVDVQRVAHYVPSSPTAARRALMDLSFTAHAASIRGPRPHVVIAISPVLLSVLGGLRWQSRGRTAMGVVTQDLYSRAVTETSIASPTAAKLTARLESNLLRRADGVVAVHESFTRQLESIGVEQKRIDVIRNWSHIAPPNVNTDAARKRMGWRSDKIVALHAGNMGLKQGLENVVAAARRADDTQAPVEFVLMGDGGRRPALEELAAGVERLSFIDPLPAGQFEDALASADVLVLNEAESVVEMSAPSKLTSYFTAGRPVVAACHPQGAAGTEIARSGGGERVAPGDPEALLDAVLAMGMDRGLAADVGARGRRYATEYLSVESAAEAYDAWVRKLADLNI